MCRPDDFPPYDPVFTTREVDARYATKVRIQAPQGSAFDGRTGVVVSDIPESSTLMVRLANPRGVRGPESTLPFGRGEVVRL